MMYNEDDGNAFLLGGEKVKSCSFKGEVGIIWEGEVLEEPKMVQQRDYDNEDELLWWDDEKTKPRMSAVIKLQTTVIDPTNPDDTGVRALWLKGESQKAVANAMRAAKVKGIFPGGYLKIQWYDERDDTPPGKKQRFLTKLYRAHYTPPVSAANQAFWDGVDGADDAARSAPKSADRTNTIDHRGATLSGGDVREAAQQSSAVLAAMKAKAGNANESRGFEDGPAPF